MPWPALALVAPLLAAAALALAGKRCPRAIADGFGLGTSVFVAGACAFLVRASSEQPVVYWFGGWTPRAGIAMGVSFVVDPIGAGLGALSGVLTAIALLFALGSFDTVGALFHALMLVFLSALVGFSLSGDLFNMFVFFELMSATAFALCGYKSAEAGPLQGALNFAVTNTIGAFVVLFGIGLLYARTGALNLAQIARGLGPAPDALVLGALALVLCGFLVKAAVVPFHFWLADAHAVAPAPVSLMFSGVMVTAGVYAVARLLATAFAGSIAPHESHLRAILVALGTATVLVGAFMCCVQRHIKRMLAFSTVSHVGVMVLGVGLLDPRALSGAALYALGHGLVKGSLFLSAGIVLHRLRSVDEVQLRGRGERAVAPLFVIGGLALAGMPPFGTYLGASTIDEAARTLGYGWVPIVIAIGAVATGGTVLRAAGRIHGGLGTPREEAPGFAGETTELPETPDEKGRVHWTMLTASALPLLLAAAVGVWPGARRAALDASLRMRDATSWTARVLEGVPMPRPPQLHLDPLGGEVLRELLVALAAAIFAGVVLGRERLPRTLRRPLRVLIDRGGRPVRRLHSGRVGDYVTWIVLGLTLVGAACMLTLR